MNQHSIASLWLRGVASKPRYWFGRYATYRQAAGFTLIELMIVVAIIGILASIALPAYNRSVIKSRRTSATTALLDFASRQEKFYSLNNAYTSDMSSTGLGYNVASGTTTLAVPSTGVAYYNLTFTPTSGTAATFTATATAIGAQSTDTCSPYTLNNIGVKGNASGGISCW